MQKIFLTTIIIVLIILTLAISISRPEMHKKIFIYDSDFEIAEQVQPMKPEQQNIPSFVNTAGVQNRYEQKVKTIKEAPVIKIQNSIKIDDEKNGKHFQNKNFSPEKTVSSNKTITGRRQTEHKSEADIPKASANRKQTQIINKKESMPEIKNSVISQNPAPDEEVILWNKWHSNIQNKIMSDVKLPVIQEGIVFKFSFDADKYGRISNLKTWSTTPAYTPYAIQYIAPVIRSYQGKEILNFPAGSKRFVTTVQGGWKISKTVKYSTPQDYSDTEKIIN